MSPWRGLKSPLLGLSEGDASSEQAPGTSQLLVNMRSKDPRTGQRRMSSREGMVHVGVGEVIGVSDPVTMIHQVGEHRPLKEFVQLTETPQTGVLPTSVDTAWSSPADGVLSVDVDKQGNAYALGAGGYVAIYNEKGKRTSLFETPAPAGFSLVPRIRVDDLGEIWLAWRQSLVIEGGASRMYRLYKVEDDLWGTRVELIITGEVQDFDSGGVSLVVAEHAPSNPPLGEFFPPASVTLISGALSSAPYESWTRAVANPVTQVRIANSAIYVSSAPNLSRGSGSGPGLGGSTWTPRELVVDVGDEYDAPTQLWWWMSSIRTATIQAPADGQVVSTWASAMYDASEYDDVVHTGPRNYVQRAGYNRPKFAANALNGLPGLRFENTLVAGATDVSGLMSSAEVNDNRSKLSVNDNANWHRLPSPGMTHPWAMELFIRPESPSVFDQGASFQNMVVYRSGEFFVMVDATGVAESDPDWDVKIVVPNGAVAPAGAGWTDLGNDRSMFTYTLGVTDASPAILISFSHGGAGATNLSSIRVNGLGVSTFTLDVSFPINRARGHIGYATSEHLSGATQNGYRGWIMDQAIALGRTGAPGAGPNNQVVRLDTIERFEAFSAYSYSLSSLLPLSHSYDTASGPPPGLGDVEYEPNIGLTEPLGLLVKLKPDGSAVWTSNGTSYGMGADIDGDGNVFTAGFNEEGIDGTATVIGRKAIDEGQTLRTTGIDTFEIEGEARERWRELDVRILADGRGGAFWPFAMFGGSGGEFQELRYIKADGTASGNTLWTFSQPITGRTTGMRRGGRLVDGTFSGGIEGPEFLYIINPIGLGIERLSVLGERPTGATRSRRISVFATAASGGLARLEVGSYLDWSVQAGTTLQEVRPWALNIYPFTMMGDGGDTYYVYDSRSGLVRQFGTDERARGAPPQRCRFGVSYRARATLGGGDEKGQLAFSGFGDMFDFDDGAEVFTAETAIVTTATHVRQFPDIVVGLSAWNDDLLIVFCGGSVWRGTGDPASGGTIDQLIRNVGLADTWAHAIDPDGVIYFLGTDGHVYRMLANGTRDKISEGKIRRRLETLDLSRYRVELQWDVAADGLWIVQIPRTGFEPDLTHYFWERSDAAWHPMTFAGGVGRCVTAIGTQDGDGASDRALLLGFADGAVRATAKEARTDDGVDKLGRFVLGPILPQGDERDVKMPAARMVMAHGSDPVWVEGRASSTADVLGASRGRRRQLAGRNLGVPTRVRGAATWLDISGVGNWAVEEIAANIDLRGKKHPTHRRNG